MYTFGIDIGGTRIKIGLFLEGNVLLEKWSIPTNKEKVFEDIASSIWNYCSTKGISQEEILGYGIGIPSFIQNGIAVNCVNLGRKNVNVEKEFQEAMGQKVSVAVSNDARLAALGEFSIATVKCDSIVFLTLGTGVGGGIIVNGQLQQGKTGLCGEIGHIRVDQNHQFECACGKKGCLETVSSATGIVRLYQHYASKDSPTRTSAKEVLDAAKQGDMLCLKVLDEAAMYIAKVLAILALTVNPDVFIIGGGVSDAGQILIDNIKKHYLLECLEEAKSTDIQLSKLRNDAGMYGASALIKHKENGAK